MISNKKHLTEAGLIELINIRATLNKGLSEILSDAFTQVIPVPRPEVPSTKLDSNTPGAKHWLAGFATGEGCFIIKVSKSNTHKLGKKVAVHFLISQHSIDSKLLESFREILGCGSYSILDNAGVGTFTVSGFNDIFEKIIPVFESYPILGVKAKDFDDFKEASILIKSKAHLTEKGLDQIVSIKSRMNTKRII